MAVPKRMWSVIGIVAVVTMVVLGIAISRVMYPPLPAPVQAVQSVLELREGRSTDASAYAQYFEDASVATALARAASASDGTTSSALTPIPKWERPYLSTQASATADVVVVWTPDRRFEKWAKATVFKLEKMSGRWKIVNAGELTSTVPPKIGSEEETEAP